MSEIFRKINPNKIKRQKIIPAEQYAGLSPKKIFEQTPEERVFRRLSVGLLSNPNQLARELDLTEQVINSTIEQLLERGAITIYQKSGAILIEEIRPDKFVIPHKKNGRKNGQ